jgi:hypothetical protein
MASIHPLKLDFRILRIVCAVSACAALASCATSLREDAPRNVGPVTLTPGERHVDCVRLSDGDRVQFRFDANPAAAFSVHYRNGEAVVYPMQRPPTVSDSGFFVAAETRTYCFEWIADPITADTTRLTYHLSLQRRQ